MASLAPVRAFRRGLAHAPWSVRAWRDTAFAAAGIALVLPALAVPLLLVVAVLFALVHNGPRPLTLLVLAAMTALLPAWAALLTGLQRSRFWALLKVDIPHLPGARERLRPAGLPAALRSRLTWRQAAYHALVTPLAAAGGVLTLAAWAGGVVLIGYPLAKTLLVQAGYLSEPKRVADGAAGVILVLAAPWLAAAVVRLDTRAALALLGPSRAEELARRVETLAESRAGVVDAADAERRRIERDLHDGAQRRLVSLAMNLGMARAELQDLPEHAQKVIIEAHEEAKLALAELRDLVRGLHPAILEDRGLDAALSGIAARSPVPVRLWVDVPARAAPTVEAVAYFVVSEALTNIAKHSRASQAEIAVDRRGDLLRVAVTDDGIGGADPALGSGLAGLAQRAASVDGTFSITSPAGGPTVITVELPCGL